MIRTDSAGGTHGFLDWLTATHRNFSYSVGFPIHGAVADVLPLIPSEGWTKAYDSDGVERDGAWVADITGMLDLSPWPAELRGDDLQVDGFVHQQVPSPGRCGPGSGMERCPRRWSRNPRRFRSGRQGRSRGVVGHQDRGDFHQVVLEDSERLYVRADVVVGVESCSLREHDVVDIKVPGKGRVRESKIRRGLDLIDSLEGAS